MSVQLECEPGERRKRLLLLKYIWSNTKYALTILNFLILGPSRTKDTIKIMAFVHVKIPNECHVMI